MTYTILMLFYDILTPIKKILSSKVKGCLMCSVQFRVRGINLITKIVFILIYKFYEQGIYHNKSTRYNVQKMGKRLEP